MGTAMTALPGFPGLLATQPNNPKPGRSVSQPYTSSPTFLRTMVSWPELYQGRGGAWVCLLPPTFPHQCHNQGLLGDSN